MHTFAMTIGGLAVALMISAPTGASAGESLTSSQGDDYTWNNSNHLSLRIHDGEADDHDVAGEWYQAGSNGMSTAINTKGGHNNFDVSTSWIHRHRCVELVPYSADAYGPWKTPK
ncbi:hypothetical protein [Arsenicicoccus dermatophilus]|uniref:hypothetical protein n=1 Tax=Arsenicicoccus dermatophilus TaxID=1076331 RepID=UPI001F4D24CF|nr:hypothetical protein [Arsenicicoccus dermatophilus]MCH8612337.1 hypothetical protein [Arsenicicoccus dermatophilus]